MCFLLETVLRWSHWRLTARPRVMLYSVKSHVSRGQRSYLARSKVTFSGISRSKVTNRSVKGHNLKTMPREHATRSANTYLFDRACHSNGAETASLLGQRSRAHILRGGVGCHREAIIWNRHEKDRAQPAHLFAFVHVRLHTLDDHKIPVGSGERKILQESHGLKLGQGILY